MESISYDPVGLSPRTALQPPCSDHVQDSTAVRLEPIQVEAGSSIPEEDRALLYEDLIQKLQAEKTISAVYRTGDVRSVARCAGSDITLRVGKFEKGNQAIRASVGTLGYFLGKTTIKYHLAVMGQNGALLIDKDMKKTEGNDHDSLDIAMSVSRNVVKKLMQSKGHSSAHVG